MPKGGTRAGAGRKRKIKPTPVHPTLSNTDVEIVKAELTYVTAAQEEERKNIGEYELSPLAYMLMVINDKKAHPDRRDRMAAYAAPFMHPKLESKGEGKKEQRQTRAEEAASSSKFAPPPAPKPVALLGSDTRQ